MTRTLEVISLAVGDLRPYDKNSRTHSDEQVKQVADSIAEFGFTNPVLIDEKRGIIAGHCRLMAAKMLGIAEVPTITLTGLTAAQRKAYVIADNALAANAGWNMDLLKAEVLDLVDMNGDGLKDIVTGKRFWSHGRLGDPDEIADMIVFLLSDLANGVSGQTIVVDRSLSTKFCAGSRKTRRL